MSASTAIGMVGESLRNMLDDEMLIVPNVNITILAPDEAGGDNPRVNLFLYKLEQNIFLKNMDWQVSRSDSSQLVPPPLSLNLHYLMTAYAQNDFQSGNTTAHEILGEAMRVFHELPTIPDLYLVAGLSDAREQLQIAQKQIDLDELSKVWATFSEPYRLSVLYEVSVVQLDQSAASSREMARRVTEVGIPQISQPFEPLSIDELTPTSGPPGTIIRFNGNNLTGWLAYVRIFKRLVLDSEEIVDNSFEITIPMDLPLGFHEIRIDISRLYRTTFYFEVTV